MTITASAHKTLLLLALLLALSACAAGTPYKAYFGDPREDMQLATVQGGSFIRDDMLNRYLDTIRFIEVDGIPVTNSDQHRSIQIRPGFHDIKVYFSWDLGSQRGLAPAMVDYSKNRENISRTLRLNVQPVNPIRSGRLQCSMRVHITSPACRMLIFGWRTMRVPRSSLKKQAAINRSNKPAVIKPSDSSTFS
jgi:hypothetical protein